MGGAAPRPSPAAATASGTTSVALTHLMAASRPDRHTCVRWRRIPQALAVPPCTRDVRFAGVCRTVARGSRHHVTVLHITTRHNTRRAGTGAGAGTTQPTRSKQLRHTNGSQVATTACSTPRTPVAPHGALEPSAGASGTHITAEAAGASLGQSVGWVARVESRRWEGSHCLAVSRARQRYSRGKQTTQACTVARERFASLEWPRSRGTARESGRSQV